MELFLGLNLEDSLKTLCAYYIVFNKCSLPPPPTPISITEGSEAV